MRAAQCEETVEKERFANVLISKIMPARWTATVLCVCCIPALCEISLPLSIYYVCCVVFQSFNDKLVVNRQRRASHAGGLRGMARRPHRTRTVASDGGGVRTLLHIAAHHADYRSTQAVARVLQNRLSVCGCEWTCDSVLIFILTTFQFRVCPRSYVLVI